MSLAVTSRETPQKNRYLLRPPGGYHLVASTCLTKRIAPSLGRPCPPRPRTTDGPRKLPNARTGARNPKLPRIRPKARATRTREPARGTRSSPSAPEGTRSGRQAGVSDTARAVTETGRSCSTGRPNRAKARPWGGRMKALASFCGREISGPAYRVGQLGYWFLEGEAKLYGCVCVPLWWLLRGPFFLYRYWWVLMSANCNKLSRQCHSIFYGGEIMETH